MKKLVVNKETCIGCGACVATYPENFEFNDEGKSTAIDNPVEDETSLNDMASICPVGAIEVKDNEEASNN